MAPPRSSPLSGASIRIRNWTWLQGTILVGHHVLGRGPGIPEQDLITLAAFEIAVLGTAVRLELVLRTFGEVLQVARENERSTTELLEASPDAADELLRRVATKLRAGAPPAG